VLRSAGRDKVLGFCSGGWCRCGVGPESSR